jgi:hypothetical protein
MYILGHEDAASWDGPHLLKARDALEISVTNDITTPEHNTPGSVKSDAIFNTRSETSCGYRVSLQLRLPHCCILSAAKKMSASSPPEAGEMMPLRC